MKAFHMQSLVLLYGQADWYGKPVWAKDPFSALGEWKTYVDAVVRRYKNDIQYWEIWNEPADDGHSGAWYANLVKETYPTIKEACPNCKVMGLDINHGDIAQY